MNKWDRVIGWVVRAAFRRGSLDVLRAAPKIARAGGLIGAGQVARTTLRVFKNNLLAMPWISEGDELDAAIDGARADLLRSWNVYREQLKTKRAAARAEADWRQVLSAFRRNASDINRRIAAYNLKAPSESFRKSPLDPDREISRLMSDE